MVTLKPFRFGLVAAVLVLGAACRGAVTPTLTPEIEGPPDDVTPATDAPPTLAPDNGPTAVSEPGVTGVYYGQFDCSGEEAGLLAYAGRFTFDQDGGVTFVDYDGAAHTGTYTYDEAAQAYTFSGGYVFDYAEYFVDDTLTADPTAGANLPHVEGSEINCVRAEPGITGPP